MEDFQQNATSLDKLLMLISSVVGGAVSSTVIREASPEQAAVVCSLATAVLVIACTQLHRPALWWTAVGAIAGIIIGTSASISDAAAEAETPPLEFRVRCTIAGFQAGAGFITGMLLGRKIHNPHVPSLRTFLSTLGALTTGIYAVNITLRYIVAGLEAAQSLSGRLSISSTMLITALVIPGVVGYLLVERRAEVRQSETSEGESDHS
jgi:MFS family permease